MVWHRIPNAVTEHIAEIGVAAYAVFGALSLHADDSGKCWPSVDRLAELTGLTARSVRTQLRRLELAGWVETSPRTDGKTRLTNLYRIVNPPKDPRNETTPPPEASAGGGGTRRQGPPERNDRYPRNEAPVELDPKNKNGGGKAAFTPPSVGEVRSYCETRRNQIDPEQFCDFYEARGWKLTRGLSMRSWRAAVRNWERNGFSNGNGKPKPEPLKPLR